MFQGISNFAISSADLQGILAPEEYINWKKQFYGSPVVFSSAQKPTFPNSNSTRNQAMTKNHFESLLINLFN